MSPLGRVATACAGLTAAALAQQASSTDAGVVLRSTIQLVQVHVLAFDSQGRPAADLKRSEFQLLDNRKPQPLTLFLAERGTPAPSSEKSPAAAEASPGYAVILLDWLNTRYTDQVQAQDQVLRLLKNFEPRQQVALYLLGREPRLLHGFTSDRAALLEAVASAVPELDPLEDIPVSRFDARYGSGSPGGMTPEEKLFHQTNNVRDTLHTFEVIANVLSRVPGRKTLVWLTNGFPVLLFGKPQVLETSLVEDFERVLAKLNSADVAVYPIDAQGLVFLAHSIRGPMTELASRTGGNPFFDRNDLDEGIRLALEDFRISYTLGFHVPDSAAPGVHEITVRVSRPGVKLRYRESYELAVK